MKKYNVDDITELKEHIDLDAYQTSINNSRKICINRSSLENGIPTSDPMACKSGNSMDFEIFPNYNESICVSKTEIIKYCDKSNTCMISINIGK